jgi:hypothetical protein
MEGRKDSFTVTWPVQFEHHRRRNASQKKEIPIQDAFPIFTGMKSRAVKTGINIERFVLFEDEDEDEDEDEASSTTSTLE